MKKENIHIEIKQAAQSLLKLARDCSHSTISENTLFILSEINDSIEKVFDQKKIRKANNDSKTPKSLTEIVTELENLYSNLYDVVLYIYKVNIDSTIIEIQYYPRSRLDLQYRKTTAT